MSICKVASIFEYIIHNQNYQTKILADFIKNNTTLKVLNIRKLLTGIDKDLVPISTFSDLIDCLNFNIIPNKEDEIRILDEYYRLNRQNLPFEK